MHPLDKAKCLTEILVPGDRLEFLVLSHGGREPCITYVQGSVGFHSIWAELRYDDFCREKDIISKNREPAKEITIGYPSQNADALMVGDVSPDRTLFYLARELKIPEDHQSVELINAKESVKTGNMLVVCQGINVPEKEKRYQSGFFALPKDDIYSLLRSQDAKPSSFFIRTPLMFFSVLDKKVYPEIHSTPLSGRTYRNGYDRKNIGDELENQKRIVTLLEADSVLNQR